ncbi:MAG: serine hydrolase domain-containing protein [Saprospiraceae bacterium]|nr:serine hydrolase domain-containing protein [Saprospiraceae bacterium]
MTELPTQALRAALERQINERKTPGLYYAAFNTRSILFEHACGQADLANQQPVVPHSAFYAFSMTKLFTATAVMQLDAAGKLRLTDPLKQWMPEIPCHDSVQIRHLLTHTAGIPNPLPIRWIHTVEEHPDFDEKNFFDPLIKGLIHPQKRAGARFAYSNLGYVLLGRVIEKASGMPYEMYVRQFILRVADADNDLGFERMNHWRIARGYHKKLSLSYWLLGWLLDKQRFMAETTDGWRSFKPVYVNGAAYGGLIGRPAGFIKFAQDLLRPDGCLLPQKSREAMFQENRLENGKASGMCLGWFTGKLHDHRYVTHAGGGGGFYCELRLYPELGRGSLLMTNRSGFSDERWLDQFDGLLLK